MQLAQRNLIKHLEQTQKTNTTMVLSPAEIKNLCNAAEMSTFVSKKLKNSYFYINNQHKLYERLAGNSHSCKALVPMMISRFWSINSDHQSTTFSSGLSFVYIIHMIACTSMPNECVCIRKYRIQFYAKVRYGYIWQFFMKQQPARQVTRTAYALHKWQYNKK